MSKNKPGTSFSRSQAPAGAVSRRAMLGGLGLGSLGAVALPMFSGVGSSAAVAATPAPPAPGYVPVGPYTVQASCQLTEDYFLTDEVLIDLDGGDEILPFTTKSGDVEAIVLTGKVGDKQVAHLARDRSTVSGWSYTVLGTDVTGLATVYNGAVMGSTGSAPQLLLTGQNSREMLLVTMSYGASGWSATAPIPTGDMILKSGVGPAGPFFYGWSTSTQGADVTLRATVFDATHPTGASVLDRLYVMSSTHFTDVVMRYDPAGVDGWIVACADDAVRVGKQTGATSFAIPAAIQTPNLGNVIGAYGTGPDVVWQDTSGQINITFTAKGGSYSLTPTTGTSASSVATFVSDGLYRFTFSLDETVYTTQQVIPSNPQIPHQFTPPIPMVTDVAQVVGVGTDPAQTVLFSIGLDSSLGVLGYDRTGWTQTTVRQSAADIQEVASWQCQLSIADANGVAMAGAGVQITADRPAAIWQESGSSAISTTLVPGVPVTFDADSSGQLIFSIPTDELDAAQLIVQALDSSGRPSGRQVQVAPDADVQGFLAGTAGLDAVGKLDGQALLSAQNTAWDTASQSYQLQGPLFPGLAALPSSKQTAAAAAIAAAVSHVATQPDTVPQAVADIRSTCLDLTGATPAFMTSTDADHWAPAANVDTTWWQRADSDVESVFHGLRHGAIHLQQVFTSWDASAKRWVVNIVVGLEDKIQHVMNTVVTTAKDVIHVISGIVRALGAALKEFWDWLKNLVLGILAAAEKGAKVMEAWIGQLVDELLTAITDAEGTADGFFTGLTSRLDGWFAKIDPGAATFGGSTPQPDSSGGTGSSNSDINWNDVGEVLTVLQHCSPMYWLNKLKKYLPKLSSDDGPSFTLDLTQDVTDVQKDVTAAAETVTAIFDLISDSFKSIFASKSSTESAQLKTIVGDLQSVADHVLTFLDDVVDTVLDLLKTLVTALDDFFSYEYQLVPVIGRLLERAGIDTKMSIQHITCLIAAFPTAVVYRAMGYKGDMFPAQTDATAARAWADDVSTALAKQHPQLKLGDAFFSDPWGAAVNLPSSFIQVLWAVNDMSVDGGNGTLLNTIVDIAAPTMLNILQWPSTPISDSLSGWPFRGGVDKTSTDWGIIPGIILAEFAPPLSNLACLVLEKDTGGAHGLYDGYNGYVNPVINGVAGIISAVLGSVWSGRNHEGLAVAESVIGNLSYIFSFASITPYDKNPDVKAVKFVGDMLANWATTFLILAAFCKAS